VEVGLGFDNGVSVQISRGDVSGDDLVALNVGQAARNGQTVRPVLESANAQ
jgi:hypothetical protein